MIRLGHIEYSNCIPVHALLLERGAPGIELVSDVPSRLNEALARGDIDVAPCSSIEYARHASEYAILPGFAIGSSGDVQSILLETTLAPAEVHDATIAIPTASATSVVLLRILLEQRLGVRPQYRWYEQADDVDPIRDGAAAALRIGDVALRRTTPPGRSVHDLGAEWTAWTGLPFAFAVWQIRRETAPADVRRLVALLQESRVWFTAHQESQAESWSRRFGLSPDRLLRYWRSLRYELDSPMQQGLLRFYAHAAELGEAPRIETLDIVQAAPPG